MKIKHDTKMDVMNKVKLVLKWQTWDKLRIKPEDKSCGLKLVLFWEAYHKLNRLGMELKRSQNESKMELKLHVHWTSL